MTKKNEIVVGYKGFDENLKCRDMQYVVGETKIHKGAIKLCDSGLHFVEDPFDILNYYPLIGSRFAEVEATGVSSETSNDSKRVAKSLNIKAELTLDGLIKAGFKFIFDKVDWDNAKGDTSVTSGEYAHSATSGNDANSATSGEYAHSATSGNRANSATSGYGAHSATSGNDAIACSVGRKATAMGSIGCWIVLAEWSESYDLDQVKPLDVQSVRVDGKKIKADTFYKLENGKFVEA